MSAKVGRPPGAKRDTFYRITLELGHKAVRLPNPSPDKTHRWTVYCTGVGCDLAPLIEKVVFRLHQDFPNPNRKFYSPPYEVTECGYGEFDIPIWLTFRNKVFVEQLYVLFFNDLEDTNHKLHQNIKFTNPTGDFKQRLIRCGAVEVDENNHQVRSSDPFANLFGEPIISTKQQAPPPPPARHERKPKTNSVCSNDSRTSDRSGTPSTGTRPKSKQKSDDSSRSSSDSKHSVDKHRERKGGDEGQGRDKRTKEESRKEKDGSRREKEESRREPKAAAVIKPKEGGSRDKGKGGDRDKEKGSNPAIKASRSDHKEAQKTDSSSKGSKSKAFKSRPLIEDESSNSQDQFQNLFGSPIKKHLKPGPASSKAVARSATPVETHPSSKQPKPPKHSSSSSGGSRHKQNETPAAKPKPVPQKPASHGDSLKPKDSSHSSSSHRKEPKRHEKPDAKKHKPEVPQHRPEVKKRKHSYSTSDSDGEEEREKEPSPPPPRLKEITPEPQPKDKSHKAAKRSKPEPEKTSSHKSSSKIHREPTAPSRSAADKKSDISCSKERRKDASSAISPKKHKEKFYIVGPSDDEAPAPIKEVPEPKHKDKKASRRDKDPPPRSRIDSSSDSGDRRKDKKRTEEPKRRRDSCSDSESELIVKKSRKPRDSSLDSDKKVCRDKKEKRVRHNSSSSEKSAKRSRKEDVKKKVNVEVVDKHKLEQELFPDEEVEPVVKTFKSKEEKVKKHHKKPHKEERHKKALICTPSPKEEYRIPTPISEPLSPVGSIKSPVSECGNAFADVPPSPDRQSTGSFSPLAFSPYRDVTKVEEEEPKHHRRLSILLADLGNLSEFSDFEEIEVLSPIPSEPSYSPRLRPSHCLKETLFQPVSPAPLTADDYFDGGASSIRKFHPKRTSDELLKENRESPIPKQSKRVSSSADEYRNDKVVPDVLQEAVKLPKNTHTKSDMVNSVLHEMKMSSKLIEPLPDSGEDEGDVQTFARPVMPVKVKRTEEEEFNDVIAEIHGKITRILRLEDDELRKEWLARVRQCVEASGNPFEKTNTHLNFDLLKMDHNSLRNLRRALLPLSL